MRYWPSMVTVCPASTRRWTSGLRAVRLSDIELHPVLQRHCLARTQRACTVARHPFNVVKIWILAGKVNTGQLQHPLERDAWARYLSRLGIDEYLKLIIRVLHKSSL